MVRDARYAALFDVRLLSRRKCGSRNLLLYLSTMSSADSDGVLETLLRRKWSPRSRCVLCVKIMIFSKMIG